MRPAVSPPRACKHALPGSGWHRGICGYHRHRPLPGRRLQGNLPRGGGDARDFLVGRDLVEQIGQDRRVADVASGDLPLGDCPAITCRQWTARTSSVSSSIPRWILRQTRRLGPPCLRAFHSPSPSTLIPVLSIRRCSGPLEPRYGMLTASVFWRRDSVLKSGPAQFRPIRRKRLSRNPVVWRSAIPNRTFIVRHVWMAVSL